MANILSIGTSAIRELDGLFSLNDLHAAAGGAIRHQPTRFMRNESTQALIAELTHSPEMVNDVFKVIKGSVTPGTYACRELVIAYAAWISAAFHLKVIRVFLATSTPTPQFPALQNRTLSPEVEKAILDKSFQLGSEAHELARKHLRALVSDQIATSKEAIRQIQATTLAQALGKNTVPTKVYEELMVAFHASRTIHTVMAGVVENIQRMENPL